MKTLTITYRNVVPGEESSEILSHPKVRAMAWGETMQQRDVAIDALEMIMEINTDPSITKLIQKALSQIEDLYGD